MRHTSRERWTHFSNKEMKAQGDEGTKGLVQGPAARKESDWTSGVPPAQSWLLLPSLHPDILHCLGPTQYQRKEPCPFTQDSQKSSTSEMEMGKPACWERTLPPAAAPPPSNPSRLCSKAGTPRDPVSCSRPCQAPMSCPGCQVGARERQVCAQGGQKQVREH